MRLVAGNFTKHREIAKRWPEYISSVVEVSSYSYQKTFLGFVKFEFLSFVTISVLSFYHNSSFFVLLFELSQFEI